MSDEENKGQSFKEDMKESARKIWLAGLGAFAVAQEEGSRLFDRLVAKGQEIEASEENQRFKQRVRDAKDEAAEAWEKVSDAVSDKVRDTVERLRHSHSSEIERLKAEIAELKGRLAGSEKDGEEGGGANDAR
ncbi:MAG TPA: phasin family protein [Thermoanaerobaculia bacterium]|nr:phasin family protein [Thermoanaerobaculia bacterium]